MEFCCKINFRLLAVALCFMVPLALAACTEKDDDDNNNGENPVATGEFDGSSIVGKWQLVSIMTDSSDVNTGERAVYETTDQSDEAYRQFNANGTVKMTFQSGGSLSGTYTYDANTHILEQTIMDDLERGTVTTLTDGQLVYYATYANTTHTVIVETMTYVRVQ